MNGIKVKGIRKEVINMTRQTMIDILVTELMITRNEVDKADGIEYLLRNGFKGFNNYSDENLKKLVDEHDPKKLEWLKACAELLKIHREEVKER